MGGKKTPPRGTTPKAVGPRPGGVSSPPPPSANHLTLGVFSALWRLRKQKNFPEGVLFLVYLILYSAIRFAITFWSSYRIVAFGLNQSQIISIAALAVAIPCLIALLRRAPAGFNGRHHRPYASPTASSPLRRV